MDPTRTALPAANECLISSYASRGQKGGTLIDETVPDLATHIGRMLNPASYRPKECACGSKRLHIHDRRERKTRATASGNDGLAVVVMVMVFLCVGCWATWRVLPMFLARCLWRTWDVVENTASGTQKAGEPKVPKRTVRRWRARLSQAARLPMQVLASSGNTYLRHLAQAVGLEADRRTLANAYREHFGGAGFAALAALLHRLSPGIRLT